MSESEQNIGDIMGDLYGPLPRQGPGSIECTRKAFSMLGALPERPMVLDIGCGTGGQTLELARLTDGCIVALDVFDWALDRLSEQVVALGLIDRIRTTKQSMMEMDFREETFDLIWSEGALYIMGFENALRKCRELLKSGGFLAATEVCWLRTDPPQDLREFWQRGYPDIKPVADNVHLVADCGFQMVGHFTLPDSAWWDDYYTPMRKSLPALRDKYAGSPEAIALLEENEVEMALHERYSAWYGYEFFICRRPANM